MVHAFLFFSHCERVLFYSRTISNESKDKFILIFHEQSNISSKGMGGERERETDRERREGGLYEGKKN